jgi:uncharacterized protein YndB with AHSA1/START domain
MPKIHFSITIDAPQEKVWNTMLDPETYREWTSVFSPGSYYEGNWEQGSKIVFLGPDEHGNLGGMVSTIAENRPHEFISIQHLGVVADGVEDTTSAVAQKWAGFENYTFKDKGHQTELLVEMDMNEESKQYFEAAWPNALQKLKALTEQT